MDIWETFGREANAKRPSEVTTFFIGAKSAGKSTLINRFVDQQGSHKATVGLEYIYCKKGNLLCNIWEGGGNFDTNLIKMIQVPLKSVRSSSHRLVFCVVLDLSNLSQLSEICSNFMKFREAFIHNSIHADNMIICNKYDKFSSSPNEIKKVVNTYLRVIAKTINAPLIQVSNQSESSMLKYKKMLNKLVFKTATSITSEIDINKNLIIVDDNWESIGLKSKDKARNNLDQNVKQERIGSSKKREKAFHEKFGEPRIDSAIIEYSNVSNFHDQNLK